MDPELLGRLFGKIGAELFVVLLVIGLVIMAIRNRQSAKEGSRAKKLSFWRVVATAFLMVIGLMVIAAILSPMLTRGKSWTTYTAPEGNFSVLLPAMPEMLDKTKDFSSVESVTRMYIVDGGWTGVSYLVQYVDFPKGTLNKAEAGEMLGMMRDAYLTSEHKAAIDSQPVSLGTYPGLEYTYQEKRGLGVMQVRMFVVGDRVYILMAGPLNEKRADPNGTKFFDSFALIE